jgi:hypothetical protein
MGELHRMPANAARNLIQTFSVYCLIRDDEVFSAEKIRRCQAESSGTETSFSDKIYPQVWINLFW